MLMMYVNFCLENVHTKLKMQAFYSFDIFCILWKFIPTEMGEVTHFKVSVVLHGIQLVTSLFKVLRTGLSNLQELCMVRLRWFSTYQLFKLDF